FHNESNKLHELTQNVLTLFYFVVKCITGSAAWRQDFKRFADAIVSNSLKKAIFLILQEQISRQIIKQNCQLLGHFKEIQFTQADWMQIKHLNNELE
ncbi:hypothetical protein VP01_13623g1, partial [Puccinia sorghi]